MAVILRRARIRVMTLFLVLGLLFGSWVPRIPAVKAALHLSAGTLGIALLAPALGAVVAMLGAGAVVASHGSRTAARWSLLVFALPPVAIGGAHSLGELFAVLLVWGVGIGSLDVSINSQAVELQEAYGRPIMSNFHGMFSIGALIGGGTGALVAAAGIPIDVHLAVAGGLTLVIGEWAVNGLLFARHDHDRPHRRFVRPDRQLMILGAMGFGALLCEGAASDWSAVYLKVDLLNSVGIAGLGYVAFSVAMIAGRLSGDRLTRVLGRRRLFRVSGLVAAVGFGTGLAVGTTVSTIVGFGILGIGVSCAAPLIFSAAGEHSDSGPSVATVTTGSYLGFLSGPAIIGGIASGVDLQWALAAVPLIAALSVLTAGAASL